MPEYTLKLKTITAICPASGESWGGVLDNDVVYDDVGLPFIPAKRIRGILLESAIDVAQALSTVKPEHWSVEKIADLFGERGRESSSPLIIDDAKLENHKEKKSWLKWAQQQVPDIASRMQVLSLFTSIRAQTAMASSPDGDISDSPSTEQNGKDKKLLSPGVAMPHSLRMQRVLKRGLVFDCPIITSDHEQSDFFESLLALSASVSRRMGLNRNRGLGEIAITLFDKAGNEINVSAIVDKEVPRD
jgi:CRISPR-associated protein Csx10